jgi:hypothetical protein
MNLHNDHITSEQGGGGGTCMSQQVAAILEQLRRVLWATPGKNSLPVPRKMSADVGKVGRLDKKIIGLLPV